MPTLNQAQVRHAQHYLALLHAANELYQQGGDALKNGLSLSELEWSNIQIGQAWSEANAEKDDTATELCMAYSRAGVDLLDLRQHPCENTRWFDSALSAARRLNQRDAEAALLSNLGSACQRLGESRKAIVYHEQALSIAREIVGRKYESNALGNLGVAYAALGEIRKAITFYEQQLALAQEINDRSEQNKALGNMGLAYAALSEYRRAIEFYEQALIIVRKIGDRRGEGNLMGSMGSAYYYLSEFQRAI
jgi:tetratricopeptide (TPR) repeat protein